jgi:hypothetical protein
MVDNVLKTRETKHIFMKIPRNFTGVPEAVIWPIWNEHSLTTLCFIRVVGEMYTLLVPDDVVEVIRNLLFNRVL